VLVFVDEPAEPFGPSKALRVEVLDRKRCPRRGVRRALIEDSVRSMLVVVDEVLVENGPALPAMKIRIRSRHSRRTVPTNRSANAFALGARIGVLMISTPSVRNTSSKLAVNLVSRSLSKNLAGRSRAARTTVKFRACWVTQSPTGFAVTPARCTLVGCRSR
jgi:hypothetical protein